MKRSILTFAALLSSVMFFSGFTKVSAPAHFSNTAGKTIWNVASYTIDGKDNIGYFKNAFIVMSDENIAIMDDNGYAQGFGYLTKTDGMVSIKFIEEQWSDLNGDWKANTEDEMAMDLLKITSNSDEASDDAASSYQALRLLRSK